MVQHQGGFTCLKHKLGKVTDGGQNRRVGSSSWIHKTLRVGWGRREGEEGGSDGVQNRGIGS